MKICIDGHRFDTKRATHHWDLSWHDERSNEHTGDLYRSAKGTWYVYTPSQWGNRHSWEIITPEDALDQYSRYLTNEEKTEIAEVAGLDWE
jgi:hypothetical protein